MKLFSIVSEINEAIAVGSLFVPIFWASESECNILKKGNVLIV